MNKNLVKVVVFSFFFSVSILHGYKLVAQEEDNEMLTASMRMERDNIKQIFSDNRQALRTNNTDNMLSDDQCREWIGNRSIIRELFTEIDDCTGDSLHDIVYENGLLLQEGVGDQLFFVGTFKTSKQSILSGTSKTEIKEILGTPYKESDVIMVYKKGLHPEIAAMEGIEFDESVILFFDNNKLRAIWVKFYLLC